MTHEKKILGIVAVCFLALQCANKTTSPTRLAIKNNNTFSVTTVTVKSSDGSKTATFTGIAAGATSAFQEISFPSLTGVSVTCDTNGCNQSSIDLTTESDNTITITTNANVGSPAVTPGSGGSGW